MIKFILSFVFKCSIRWCRITVISTDFLLVFEKKYYLQVYLDNCGYKMIDKQMIDYLNVNRFGADEDQFFSILINASDECCIMIELIKGK